MKTFYYSYIYRPVQKLMHRYNIHHTRLNPDLFRSSDLDPAILFVPNKCEWCGLRGNAMMTHENLKRVWNK